MKKEIHAMEENGLGSCSYVQYASWKKAVGNRWVLTEKDDGTLRSRTFCSRLQSCTRQRLYRQSCTGYKGQNVPPSAHHLSAYETTYQAI
jgi:hypothetical protein